MDKERSDKITDLASKLNKLVRVRDALKEKDPCVTIKDNHGCDVHLTQINDMVDGMLETVEHQIKCNTNDIKNEATGN